MFLDDFFQGTSDRKPDFFTKKSAPQARKMVAFITIKSGLVPLIEFD